MKKIETKMMYKFIEVKITTIMYMKCVPFDELPMAENSICLRQIYLLKISVLRINSCDIPML